MRGRPAGQMTHRRRQVLERFSEAAINGERISLARMARECGLNSYRDVRKTLRDLRNMGVVA